MNQKTEIQNFALEKFSFLEKEKGLSGPIFVNKNRGVDIYYLAEKIGLQIEIDWNEYNVFVLVVLLSGGKIPGGYYMDQGLRRRIHLEKALKELKIQDQRPNIIIDKRNKDALFIETAINQRIALYCDVLHSNVDQIINAGEALFCDNAL